MIAVMKSGALISVIQGEGANACCFAGELLNPTERETRGQGHISCMWDRAKIDHLRQNLPGEPDYGGDSL